MGYLQVVRDLWYQISQWLLFSRSIRPFGFPQTILTEG